MHRRNEGQKRTAAPGCSSLGAQNGVKKKIPEIFCEIRVVFAKCIITQTVRPMSKMGKHFRIFIPGR